ncbi:MAG: SLBB domain-containing protein [Candidatus Rokuibacteriota bacterium]
MPRAPGTLATTPVPTTPARSIAGPDYRLGPGDVLDVLIVGRLEVSRLQVVVDPEGAVNLPPLGAIPVAGLPLLEANRRLAERARTMFRYAEVSVAVSSPRSFEITISGEVERPGTVQVLATQRLHEVILAQAGGITSRGSVRRVELTRPGETRAVDLLLFELGGDVGQNPYVQEGLRVHVPPRGGSMTLAGAVRRPGEYEFGPSGSLRDLLDLTGGVMTGSTLQDARLTRIGTDGRKETVSVDLRTALSAPADVTLQPGDALFVPPITILQDVVELRGAFNGTSESSKTATAGKATIVQRYELAQGDRVRDLVIRAGGAAAYADLRFAFVERGGFTGPRQRVPVDLQRLLVEKDETQNLLFQNGDLLFLPVAEDKVYVVGEVKAPGSQDYRPDLTPREYLAMAGGPGNRAKVSATTVTFRNGRTYAMAEAPPLEPGSVVTVPEVAVKWWQDYVLILQAVASILTSYTALFVLFRTPPLSTSTTTSTTP